MRPGAAGPPPRRLDQPARRTRWTDNPRPTGGENLLPPPRDGKSPCAILGEKRPVLSIPESGDCDTIPPSPHFFKPRPSPATGRARFGPRPRGPDGAKGSFRTRRRPIRSKSSALCGGTAGPKGKGPEAASQTGGGVRDETHPVPIRGRNRNELALAVRTRRVRNRRGHLHESRFGGDGHSVVAQGSTGR